MKRAQLPALMMALAIAACHKSKVTTSTPTPPVQQPPVTTSAQPEVASNNAAEEERRRLEALRMAEVTLGEMIHFEYDKSELSADARAVLDRKIAVLNGNPRLRVRVMGHADERGSVEYNLALSLRRANIARDYITGFGIDGSRIEVTGFGEERPLLLAHDESAWSQNRRDEFALIR